MAIVKRLDASTTAKTKLLDDGTIHCEARIARAGVYKYVQADGSVSLEYRSPDEVFKADALQSFDPVPLTLNHPAIGEVTPSNYRIETRGVVVNVRQDPENAAYVLADVVINDAQALAAVQDGTVQLSCGYSALRTPVKDMTVTDELTGETFKIDAVLSDITGNHVAIVPAGRAGPGARLMLDALPEFGVEMSINDEAPKAPEAVVDASAPEVKAVQAAPVTPEPVDPMDPPSPTEPGESTNPSTGNPDVEPESEVATLTLEDQLAAVTAERESFKAQHADVCKQLDACKAKLDAVSKALAEVEAPEKLDALVADRAAVVTKGKAHGIKTDALPSSQIRKAVVAKAFPKLKLDSFSNEQLSDLFDSVVSPSELAAPAPQAETTVVFKPESNPVELAYEAQSKRYGITR